MKLALIALILLAIPGAHHEHPSHRVLDSGSDTVLRSGFAAVLRARPHARYVPLGKPMADSSLSTSVGRVGAHPMSDWLVTAYCLDGTTASGQRTRPGIVAAGSWLPFGAHIELRIGDAWRTVVVADRGSDVHGRHLDLWMGSCTAAVDWGVREVPGWVSATAI